jgi:hypothetical protein
MLLVMGQIHKMVNQFPILFHRYNQHNLHFLLLFILYQKLLMELQLFFHSVYLFSLANMYTHLKVYQFHKLIELREILVYEFQ